jgi:hypothetical protein
MSQDLMQHSVVQNNIYPSKTQHMFVYLQFMFFKNSKTTCNNVIRNL